MKYDLSNKNPIKNTSYEYIKTLCEINSINLIPVTIPMCSNTKGIDYFDKVIELYPEIFNLEAIVSDDKYFNSCGHMNEAGAKLYTKYILNTFF